jgi:hypothetical protein
MGRVHTTKHSQLESLLTTSAGKSGAGTHFTFTFAVVNEASASWKLVRSMKGMPLQQTIKGQIVQKH